MALPGFYNVGDQAIYSGGEHFIPQEQYRLNYTPSQKLASTVGIPNTEAAYPYIYSSQGGGGGGGGGGAGGNLFNYGTAVDPVALGAYGEPGYSGGLPGNVQQVGWGRQEDPEGGAYLRPRKEIPGIASMALGVLPFGNLLRRKIEDQMNPVYDPNATLGGYKTAGLDATGKGLYNTLAGQGMLFEGSSGLKTATGKNFMAKGYVEGQKEILGKIKDKYGSIQNAKDYFDANPDTTNFLKTQLNEALSVTGKLEEQEAYDKQVATRTREKRIQNLKEQGEKDIHHGDVTTDQGTTDQGTTGDGGGHVKPPGTYDTDTSTGGSGDHRTQGGGYTGAGTSGSYAAGPQKGGGGSYGPWSKADGGRIGYNRGRVVNPGGYQGDEFEDENTLEFMQDQGVPYSEMAETSPFEMRIQELMDTGMSWQEAYDIASDEFNQLAEGPEESFSEEGIASIV